MIINHKLQGRCRSVMKSSKWRSTSIGKGVKRPNPPNMKGLSLTQKVKLRNKIKIQKETQRKKINQVRQDLKKIQNSVISLSGLEALSPKSIKSLQDARIKSMMRVIRTTSDLMVASRKLTELEKKFQKSLK